MKTPIPSILTLVTAVSAQITGFDFGATNSDGSCLHYADFVRFFNEAKTLSGGRFTTARLYTSVQCGTAADPIEAFRAAIDTNTQVMVGLWASAGRPAYENELNALLAGARNLGTAFTDRVLGISVGSEDLYRSSDQGIRNNAGAGATGAEIEGYIGWLRDWVRGTALEGKPVGHADTWTAWILPENRGVANSVDWLGHNSFPYWEQDRPNSIDVAKDNFNMAVGMTESVASGKPVWVTETGWPHSGPNFREAVAGIENAQRYWKEVGCSLFGTRNVFWYTMKDANSAQSELAFSVTPFENGTPFFDLTC